MKEGVQKTPSFFILENHIISAFLQYSILAAIFNFHWHFEHFRQNYVELQCKHKIHTEYRNHIWYRCLNF
ncbi:hypothetical protein SAMN06265348_11069 [Pedobacter westerhofensis]|uniref:Uncharacterized protein n=1 Tax=Pedobacter westerhofensis TaxID=425512 RepID=A0A521F4V7_9SPHI|nr:hypothetical protein SAMN06265348_11069 [Pedobacter westerhofensis]